jgi:hypothetical protein
MERINKTSSVNRLKFEHIKNKDKLDLNQKNSKVFEEYWRCNL